MRGWHWRANRDGPGRPFSELFISSVPHVSKFVPNPMRNPEPVKITAPELEVIRLLDLEDLTQEKAAEKMKTSRGTVWRLCKSARKKIAQALIEGRPLLVLPKGIE